MLADDYDGAASGRGEDPKRSTVLVERGGSRREASLRRALRVVVALAIVLLGIALVRTTGAARTTGFGWGWDETMHAELPAVRILLHAERGEFGAVSDVVQECDQYPFVYPVCLAAWQGVFGIGEHQARTLGLWTFLLLTLVGVGRLARRVALAGANESDGRRRSLAVDAALLAVLAGAASPLARRYAPTLYLECPALVTIAFALEGWLARRDARTDRARRRWDLVTGTWIALAFFTKFNYGLLLIGAVAVDGAVELARARDRTAALRSLVRVFTPLLAACAWWFLLPFPGGLEHAAEHRDAFWGFVSGNTQMQSVPGWLRRTNWLTGVAPHPALVVAMAIVGVAGLVAVRTRGSLTMAIVLFLFVVPVVLHPFQLDRFLLPASMAIWTVSAVAAAHWLRRSPVTLGVFAAAVTVLCLSVSTFRAVSWAGFPVAEEGSGSRAFQEEHVNSTLGVFGPPATNGLTRGTHERLLDLIAGAVGPSARVGWLGQSAEVSPAALHVGLLERGGSVERFLRDAHRPMDLDPVPMFTHSGRTDAEILAFAETFEHLVLVEFGDLKNRGSRRWIKERWHRPVVESDAFEVRPLGVILVDRSVVGPMPVRIELASRR